MNRATAAGPNGRFDTLALGAQYGGNGFSAATLRVHGEVSPDWERLTRHGHELAHRLKETGIDWWEKQLEEYVAPPLDVAVDEALLDYMNRRKASFPDSNV